MKNDDDSLNQKDEKEEEDLLSKGIILDDDDDDGDDDEEDSNKHININSFEDSLPILSESENSTIGNINTVDLVDDKSKSVRKHIIGFICILVVVFLWVFSGIITQVIFTEEDFNKPFFLTYFSTSIFSLYLFGFTFKWKEWTSIPFDSYSKRRSKMLLSSSSIDGSIDSSQPKYKFTIKQILRISLSLAFIWFLANYTYNLSLARTSVATNTILSTLSGIFALFLSVFFKVDKFTFEKLIATLFTLVGVILVSYSDIKDNNGQDSILGDIEAVVGAFLYGLYGVFLKKLIVSEDNLPMPMMFGFLGLFNFLFLWPIFLILNLLKFEYFELPSLRVFLYLLFNGIFGSFISDLLDSYSVVMTSPVINSVGLSLSIPFAMISDFVLNKEGFSLMYIAGSIMVIFGFILSNLAHQTFEAKLKHIESKLYQKFVNIKNTICK
ncbi:hypothetical protein DLAC_03557 [Tieghemostelium lacteum]|uniref:EamA domain-containing protein n=1 Tax=Tieghemostelium lacteum TaxID=361077 RepID=A0A152A195_TIELA|nr:hypothetical protein DLAC_03557 [Tieghemostelium lacteum]|eukprot:KYQ99968.1 hypothetical protein DLAC_03557 [Tieghemostelium lacteum]